MLGSCAGHPEDPSDAPVPELGLPGDVRVGQVRRCRGPRPACPFRSSRRPSSDRPVSPPACRAAAERNSTVPKTLFVESTRNASSDAGTATSRDARWARPQTAGPPTGRPRRQRASSRRGCPASRQSPDRDQTERVVEQRRVQEASIRKREQRRHRDEHGRSASARVAAEARAPARRRAPGRARASTLNINRSSIRSEKCEAKVPAWTTIQKTGGRRHCNERAFGGAGCGLPT